VQIYCLEKVWKTNKLCKSKGGRNKQQINNSPMFSERKFN
jgi:hypothetical protein